MDRREEVLLEPAFVVAVIDHAPYASDAGAHARLPRILLSRVDVAHRQ